MSQSISYSVAGFAWRLTIATCLCVGCSRPPAPVDVAAVRVAAPPVLASELRAISDLPVRIDTPVVFRNNGSRSEIIALAGKGCSCYGLTTQSGPIQVQDVLTIAAGEQLPVYFTAKMAGARDEQDYHASFSMPVAQGGRREVRVECTLRIEDDVALDPQVLSFDVVNQNDDPPHADRPVVPKNPERTLTVSHAYRSPVALHAPPQLHDLPAFLIADRPVENGVPEQLTPGLWKEKWHVPIRALALPAEVAMQGGRIEFHVEFPAAGSAAARPQTPIGETGRRSEDGLPPLLSSVLGGGPGSNVAGLIVVANRHGIVAPARVHFGNLSVGATRSRRLVLTAADDHPFQASLRELPDGVTAAWDRSESAVQQWLTVFVTPQQAGSWERTLVIQTTREDMPEVGIILEALVDAGS